jgi:hypothetical protein
MAKRAHAKETKLMKRLLLVTVLACVASPLDGHAGCEVVDGGGIYAVGRTLGGPVCGTTGGQYVELSTALTGEDTLNNVLRVEHQFSPFTVPVTADTLMKASAGYVDSLICTGTDAAATAGTIILYNNTAESGTILYQVDVQAVAYTEPFVLPLHSAFSVGLYLGFTTTTDMRCIAVGR